MLPNTDTEKALINYTRDNIDYYVIMSRKEFDLFKRSGFYCNYNCAIWDMERRWWNVFFEERISEAMVFSMGIHIGRTEINN